VQVARVGSRELFTLAVLALALGIALSSALLFGVSLALGAFLAGMVISESDLSHQAAADALPLRDAFAVLFFVSVGMLFHPEFVITAFDQVIAIVVIIVLAKALVAFLIVTAAGYPFRSGLTVAAGLAQIGEFSFILGGLGVTLGLLSTEGLSLILAGALLSITLNPVVFRVADLIERWLQARPRLTAFTERRAGGLAELTPTADQPEFRNHAVICGYGRVGQIIGEILERRGFRYIVIDQDRRLIEDLRARGIPALYGSAANPVLLEHVNLDRARVLVVALSDPPVTRQIIAHARRINPRLNIVVRTHSEQEWEHLQAGRASEAVLGERELALEMARYTLRRFGISILEVQAIIESLRAQR
jgi:monovalent cation:H+ antiporter-2, CPA2 family